ncbi:MAG: RraA family protein [Armatimonadota bacterium]
MSDEERARLRKLYEGLRTTDVGDGLDYCGLQDVTLMSADIKPLWRNIETFSHRIVGFANTLRFVPTKRRPGPMPADQWRELVGKWYRELAPGPDRGAIRPGDVIVIDAPSTRCGFIGSNNAQGWMNAGAEGVVTNGGARDTDELIKQQVPVYCTTIGRTIRPGRLEFDSANVTVNVGGVKVSPEDLIVADGDGVVVVPQDFIEEAAKYAREIHEGDARGRAKLYEEAGLEPDFTLQ